MLYGDCTLLLYRKYFKIFKAAINPTHAGLCSKGYAALVMQKLLRVYGRHLVIKKEKNVCWTYLKPQKLIAVRL